MLNRLSVIKSEITLLSDKYMIFLGHLVDAFLSSFPSWRCAHAACVSLVSIIISVGSPSHECRRPLISFIRVCAYVHECAHVNT